MTERQRQLIGKQPPQMLKEMPPYTELPIGDVIHQAIEAGLRVEAEPFEQGSYLDIGTPENLRRAIAAGLYPSE